MNTASAPLLHPPRRALRGLAAVLALTLAAGCATVPGGSADPRDPWEGYNRSMTQFNEAVDRAVLRPVASAYKDIVPEPVRTGVGNFFGNLSDVWSLINNVLQGKPEGALYSFWRVVINTTIGLGGVLDPASEMRLTRHREDFGQTLGRWGVPPGPYFVLPLLGPSTLRDAAALPLDYHGNPLAQVNDIPWRNSLSALNIVDSRARLVGVDSVFQGAALDAYTFRRDTHLQRRLNEVHDGRPPQGADDYPVYDNPDAAAPAALPLAPPDTPASAPASAPEHAPAATAAPAPSAVSGTEAAPAPGPVEPAAPDTAPPPAPARP
ncbi:MAG: VacJ family lipoprotein [Comamonadaceae bacterium]|nr:VacJ family lipoprotein [Comamonadaceae bacterium]